jgi:hypothetical protein
MTKARFALATAAFPRRPAARSGEGVEAGIDEHVDAREEEARDRRDVRERLARRAPILEAVDVRLGDGLVAGKAEEEGHVDVDSLGGELADRREPRGGTRDLDEDVRTVERPPQAARLVEGPLGVVGETRRDLERDVAVQAVALAMEGKEEIGGSADVVDREPFEERFGRQAARGEGGDGVVVIGRLRDRLLEDGGVRGHPVDPVVVDEALECTALDHGAADLVEVDRLPEGREEAEGVHGTDDTRSAVLAASGEAVGRGPRRPLSLRLRCRRRRRSPRLSRRRRGGLGGAAGRRGRSPRDRRGGDRRRCSGRRR